MIEDLNIEEIIKVSEDFAKVLSKISQSWDDVYQAVGDCDKEASDLLHEIELTDFNNVEGYLLATEVKDIRRRRRELKDYQEIVSLLRDFSHQNKALQINLFRTSSEMRKRYEDHNTRRYFPRIRKDIKLAKFAPGECSNQDLESLCPDYEDMEDFGLAEQSTY